MNMHPTGILEHQVPQPERPRGPIIEELISEVEGKVHLLTGCNTILFPLFNHI